MPGLLADEFEACVLELHSLARGPDFIPGALRALRRLFSDSHAVYSLTDVRTGMTLLRLRHPEAPLDHPPCFDASVLHQPERSLHQLTMRLPCPSGIRESIGLSRQDRDFTDAEVETFERIKAHLLVAHQHARLLAQVDPPEAQRWSALDELPAQVENVSARWELRPRQRQVLALLVRGQSNKEIARQLGCVEVTVEYHVTGLLRRTGACNRASLVTRFWNER